MTPTDWNSKETPCVKKELTSNQKRKKKKTKSSTKINRNKSNFLDAKTRVTLGGHFASE
jgi:hypothetical protein